MISGVQRLLGIVLRPARFTYSIIAYKMQSSRLKRLKETKVTSKVTSKQLQTKENAYVRKWLAGWSKENCHDKGILYSKQHLQ